MRKKMIGKITAIILAVVMMVSLMPVMGSVSNGTVGEVEAKAALSYHAYSGGVTRGTIRYVSNNKSEASSNGWGSMSGYCGGECGYASQSMAFSYVGKDVSPEYLCKGEYASSNPWHTYYHFAYNVSGITVASESGYYTGSIAVTKINTMLNRFVGDNGTGQYSPVVIHYTNGSKEHAIIIVGRNSDSTYQAIDPNRGMQIVKLTISSSGVVGGSVTYAANGCSINAIQQFVNSEPISNNIQYAVDYVQGKTGAVWVRGWVFNKDSKSSPVTIHVYVGGAAGSSNAEGVARLANTSRPDVETVYGSVGKNHGFDYTIPTTKSGTQDVYIYAINSGGKSNVLIAHKTVTIAKDTEKPIISDVQIAPDRDGYTVSCKVTDNVSVNTVRFPTWTLYNGQDDLDSHWGGTASKVVGTYNATTKIASFRVNRSDHNNEKGDYTTDIYAYDKAGNIAYERVTYTFEENKPTISNIEFIEDETGYTVSCDVSDDSEIDLVRFPTWTLYNGQDDLDPHWGGTASKVVGTYDKATGKATFHVNYSDHNNEYGSYLTHIYAYDKNGNFGWASKCNDVNADTFFVTDTVYNGHRYELYDGSADWEEARTFCESKGGHLITITSEEENAIAVKLAQKGNKGFYAIGAESIDTQGEWRWVNGDEFNYSNFDTQSIEGNTEGEPYAYLISIENPPNKQTGEWIDGSGGYLKEGYYHYSNGGFICEYEYESIHEHTIVIDPAIEATCDEDGLTQGSHCSECGMAVIEQEIIPAIGHNWSSEYTIDLEPTCSNEGVKAIHCLTCGAIRSVESIPATDNHTPGKAVKENEVIATCTEYGSYESVLYCTSCGKEISREIKTVDATGHNWGEWETAEESTCIKTGQEVRACKNDPSHKEYRNARLSNHELVMINAISPTCEIEGNTAYYTCSVCGKIFADNEGLTAISKEDTVIPPSGHIWDAGVITKESSHTEDGEITYTCTVCGETRTEPIGKEARISIAQAEISGISDMVFTGEEITVKPVVQIEGTELAEETDYDVSYSNNREIGIATVTITGKGNYTGTVEKTFRIQFGDVTDPSVFYYDPIYWAADDGITTGWADGTFRPLNRCNRASVVTFLWRLAGKPEPSEMAAFTDMTDNEDFNKAISWAAEEGITTGWTEKDGSSTFRPWNTCNRAAIVTFLWRYAGEPDSGMEATFTDMTGNSDFNKAISWAAEEGITTGWTEKDGSTFRPWNTCNRLAIVSFLYRYANE